MTNWKTTLSGLIAAGASFVIFGQQQGYIHPPAWLSGIAMFVTIGGFAALGVTSKDRDVTGGTKGQPSTVSALAAANQAPATGLDRPKQVI